ncbi:hypothetical protein Desca_1641 [Desulfotomaculum nigrificans CO-1-SRB]|uniref:DUF2922 domain-containing protein n=2 Tax=Eubacteriales TaxID=186802 RepID=K8DWT6_9FIRM|nr:MULTISPECIES: DUF2922 domain-containing protein [Eubacteriales]AEF94489.1 hypothetical protein Desca_1641 [Desulfotomaculum nigrificans CO-1-SRB]CCO06845.1 conserved hypothetical protein [Desulforamulus hydrothermalis Lam5 = DSM 18033]SHH44567.1 Protein of unknown function [Desulforamulus hydrothermalis Lam5 = DSM 18033]
MAKTLELIFVNMAGDKVTMRVTDPREDIQESEVRTVMDEIVASDVFTSSGGSLTGVAGARLVTRDVAELNIL